MNITSTTKEQVAESSATVLRLERTQRAPVHQSTTPRCMLALAMLSTAGIGCGGVEGASDSPDAAVSNNADAAPNPDATVDPDATVECEPRLALIRFDTRFDIFTVNSDGTELENITNSPNNNDVRPEWSPDGQRIAFAMTQGASPGVNMMNADGSNLRFLVDGGFHKWSPDGTELVFTRRVNDRDDVYRINADGTGEVQLTNLGGNEPIWTPNGAKIVFRSTRDGDNEIFSMNRDGSAQTNLTNNDIIDANPSISPNGTRIVFRSGLTFQTTNIRVMNIDGSALVSFFEGGPFEREASFSPDGTQIVYRSGNSISVSGTDGSDPIVLAIGGNPSWSPNGDAIAYQDLATTGAAIADPTVADSGVAITDGGGSASVVWQPCP